MKDIKSIIKTTLFSPLKLFSLCAILIGLTSCSAATKNTVIEDKEPSIREIVAKRFASNVYIGGTIGHKDWGTKLETIYNQEFSYITPSNDFKQTRIHPQPNKWNWAVSDEWVAKAKLNNQLIRLHGPIGPQSSKWLRSDNRTPAELTANMNEFLTALSQRYNNSPQVKWMDVVNETITEDGEWFGPKPGTDKWENPWTILGFEHDIPDQFPLLQQKGVPVYIIKAFEIANQHAPNLSLVINQHRMTTDAAIELMKELVLYLRYRGLRVDGIGWQAHLRKEWVDWLDMNSPSVKTFDQLIKWAHQHNLDFHVTENNIHVFKDKQVDRSVNQVYANIVQVLLNNRHNGVVSWNLWNLPDKKHYNKAKIKTLGMWDEKLNTKPAYYNLKQVLSTSN
jgi:GH35 family endo-1,4-beta-xylanase